MEKPASGRDRERSSSAVAAANDFLRRNLFSPHPKARVHLTRGVNASPHSFAVLVAVSQFDKFDQDNDPYGEHDLGRVVVAGEDYLWKIDYYDPTLTYGLEPDDPEVYRVLTIMRADEY